MFGSVPYASTPCASLANKIIFVVACVHVDSQRIYDCQIGLSLAYTATALMSSVYLTDVNINKGAC